MRARYCGHFVFGLFILQPTLRFFFLFVSSFFIILIIKVFILLSIYLSFSPFMFCLLSTFNIFICLYISTGYLSRHLYIIPFLSLVWLRVRTSVCFSIQVSYMHYTHIHRCTHIVCIRISILYICVCMYCALIKHLPTGFS